VEWAERRLYKCAAVSHCPQDLRQIGKVPLAVLIPLATLNVPFHTIIAVSQTGYFLADLVSPLLFATAVNMIAPISFLDTNSLRLADPAAERIGPYVCISRLQTGHNPFIGSSPGRKKTV